VRRGADADHRDRRARRSTTGYVMRSVLPPPPVPNHDRQASDRERSASRLHWPRFSRRAQARQQVIRSPHAPRSTPAVLPARTRRSNVAPRPARAALQSP
jgi:hypothetical protein